ncbi:AGL227Wp [Eremothecium gossypii ATCC 10895]|uniref:AGL227Wp n=1 Tax=Eremothecium gossypii (strain ATCC 10895 / CBS 109.51 / FGSC 9923 / NRRL Y-1056) TaxID=284811 RepID=Q751D3_EREGS|nr:AGL227Wp [Eremothecium gossypii ATCC 10895]AAS54264.2 AGL227Wp [Eremothecium gossypii ATCC 10895]AEY98590.1 FAGL227Wp [Eremothecium gossypii FDAG1]
MRPGRERADGGDHGRAMKRIEEEPASLYSAVDASTSSSSLVAVPGFTFGDGVTCAEQKRHSGVGPQAWKYVPQPKPPARSRSPSRGNAPARTPSPGGRSARTSVVGDSPFNFASATLQPPAGSRTAFRKGHRYKHSSVSMNFFPEPEARPALRLARALPVPDVRDIWHNLTRPRHHVTLALVAAQAVACVLLLHRAERREWTNFGTLAHFVLYDMLGTLTVVLVEVLPRFEVWGTGTLTYPFGLKRLDVLLSFGFAVSLCFVGLDLVFHVLEELVVLFVESADSGQHTDIVGSIPHSHHTQVDADALAEWYTVVALCGILSAAVLRTAFASREGVERRYKTKTPIITLAYTVYLLVFPVLSRYTEVGDYVATVSIALFVMMYGLRVARWTGTVLLMGFSTSALDFPGLTLLSDDNGAEAKTPAPQEQPLISVNHLYEPTIVKSRLGEMIEKLPQFRSNCSFKYTDLVLAKVHFEMFILLLKLNMKGGSDEEELDLRLAIDRCVKSVLPNVETTIEIERV